ncbi:hypothetical protein [Pedococcus sp. 2YAF34]|uniref:hypothetical protein n=1 Tax=Pedococcus sp. 2YAF34 TaxID=3233032 RepID=UPI003F976440
MSAGLVLPTHERWFVDSAPADWSFFLRPLPLTLTALVVVVTLVWRRLALRLDRPELPVLRRVGDLAPWVPRLLGIHLGVALLALAASGSFVAPSLDDLDGVVGKALLLLEAALGVWLITGWQQRSAAALALVLGPLMAIFTGPMALLESANLAAVAAFLVIAPAGADRHGAVAVPAVQLRWALLVLRVGVGVALIALAFTEKFTNPTMARETLAHFPALNVFSLVGLHVPTDVFIVVAGSIELLFGLLVISGALPQVAVLVAMVPFNATLVLFGQTELVGHLPVYGVFLALLAYGSNPATAAAVRWLPSRADLVVPAHRPATAVVPD